MDQTMAGKRRSKVDRGIGRRPGMIGTILLWAVLGVGTAPLAVMAGSGAATEGSEPIPSTLTPAASRFAVSPLSRIAQVAVRAPDLAAVAREDRQREDEGLPFRFAIPNHVEIIPESDGTWEELPNGDHLWRLRIAAPGALSVNLGFTRYHLPWGAHLLVYDSALQRKPLVFTALDNEDHGELWTPVFLADDLVVELVLPPGSFAAYELRLTAINWGYRFFGEAPDKQQGSCNIDVICPEGEPWRDEIRSVAVIGFGGYKVCTGFLINNTAGDQRPYFQTAYHCGVTTGLAPSLVVYWNFESPVCGQLDGGSLDQFQTGSYWRAAHAPSDFTLVELDDPIAPTVRATFAGWDRSDNDPQKAVTIHHPQTQEKSISFENDPTTTTSYLSTATPGDGSHIRITDWDVGTTEPGSSGSPLFDQNHHVVGQLHGGYAACGNDLSDWYGRFSLAWTGGGTDDSRLSTWLDPLGTAPMTLDLLDPYATGLRVRPLARQEAAGDPGGPFLPDGWVYTLENQGIDPFDYRVTADAAWLAIANGSGTLDPHAVAEVTVSLGAEATSLPEGLYRGSIAIENRTTGDGSTTRDVRLQVGVSHVEYSFDLGSNPGWDAEGYWAYGHPTGGGGQHGEPDPTSGHTGQNVYGYMLSGDYPNNLGEYNLTTTPLNCRGLSGVSLQFWRWLGVETPPYDFASVSVSNDGENFTTVWINNGEVSDTEWTEVNYDISALADDQPEVVIRWTMGPTDESYQYCGWNIDDVAIWAFGDIDVPGPGDIPTVPVLLPNVPNPFNQGTEIWFAMSEPGPATFSIFDIRGQLVRTHVEPAAIAGKNSWVWDGLGDDQRRPSSGIYICRLEALGHRSERMMAMVR